MMYPIVLYGHAKYNLMQHLRDNEIEVRDMLPLTEQPCYEGMFDPKKYPTSYSINNSGFYIGCHPGITHGQQEYVADMIYEYWRKYENR
jgi:dTDP-4-amino-4,6-dideoxygalactose transaminase